MAAHASALASAHASAHASSSSAAAAPAHPFLRAKPRVGSAAAGMHFAATERAFHPNDVPARAAAARLEISEALPARDRARWHPETTIGTLRHMGLERCTHQIATHDPTEFDRSAFNHRAEVLPLARPAETNAFGRTTRLLLQGQPHFHRTQELPLNPALEDGRARWDLSAQLFGTHAARAKQLAAQTAHWNAAARGADRRVLEAREAAGRGPPPSLVQIERERMARLREERTAAYDASMSADAIRAMHERQLGWTKANFRNAALLAESIEPAVVPPRPPPASAQERQYTALVARLAAERTAALAATRRDTSSFSFKHDGVFEAVADPDGAQRQQWSCCAANGLHSQGCKAVRRDSRAWTYD
jgi:hypothetical protein